MAESEVNKIERVGKSGSFSKSTGCTRITKRRRQNTRRYRRQKSRVRYYSKLRERRIGRKTEELCTAVSVFDITDFGEVPRSMASYAADLPIDVVEWQHQEQLNYWKSRALSLEYENRMLHQHIRNIYVKQIEENVYRKELKQIPEQTAKKKKKKDTPETIEKEDTAGTVVDESCLPPKEQISKKRAEEMKLLYGEMSPKITGMETAVQLNYELQTDQSNPPYWPHLPLKL